MGNLATLTAKVENGPSYHYEGESMSTYVDTAKRILGTVGLIGIVAASVSLLVGGLAIMNIMTTSVIERTQEIGLRRAIGATKRAIRFQFLAEAVFISCAGGVVGVVAGVAVVLLIAHWSGHAVLPSLSATLSAIASTFVVGIASGFYPARRASNLAPVEALRHA
ncbi:MAG: macB [Rhizobacter sp.]|nr:macB [Rhizobacter sp.]